MGRISESVGFAVEAIIGIFIFFILFSVFLPMIIDTINNNSTTIGMPQATILVVSLLGLIFVAGLMLKFWDKVTGKDNPPNGGYPQMGGY
jgi:xanthine/uracil/vitamin C permease (AzgA family)